MEPSNKRRKIKYEKKRSRQIKAIKNEYNIYSDYDPSCCIKIEEDYQSKDKYSENKIATVLDEIPNIKSTFPSVIINQISGFAQGKIVCCAHCKDKKFESNLI